MARPVRLPPRLAALASLVPPCQLLLDIGADHALLPIWLIGQERCQAALATDIRPGPLRKARANIRRAGLEHKIKTRQADGLNGFLPEPETVVVLAGMGGMEIQRILELSPAKWPLLVIQAMRDLPSLRGWLYKNGYEINQELLVRDKRFLYVVLRARYTGGISTLAGLSALVGPRLLEQRPALFAEHLAWLHHKLAKEVPGQSKKQLLLDQLADLIKEEREKADAGG